MVKERVFGVCWYLRPPVIHLFFVEHLLSLVVRELVVAAVYEHQVVDFVKV